LFLQISQSRELSKRKFSNVLKCSKSEKCIARVCRIWEMACG
jgi:hypothetical protein